ncbi:hypothetical protein MK852_01225 [Shewanella benthica]|nr:hypothetical protein [Shewanella benthica]
MAYNFSASELTSEKSLWDVYKLSRRILPSKFQVVVMLGVAFCLSLNVFYFDTKTSLLLSNVRSWATMGFNFSITTLGFLIAGFTIFATISKPKMMLAMMEFVHPETGLKTLKYNFFAFMKVFIAYIFFASVYLTIMLFGQTGGLLDNLLTIIPNGDCIKVVLIRIAYIIVGSSFVYLLLMLKSFVFNIYAIVMNFLRWEYQE